MRLIPWNSTTALLLDDEPNHSFGFDLTAELPAYVEPGLTSREARTQRGDTLRLSIRQTCTIQGSDLIAEARNSMQSAGAFPVLLPLWIAKRIPGDPHPVSAQWWGVYTYGVEMAVYATADLPVSYPADTYLIPLMVGRLTSPIDPQFITGEAVHVEISFAENSAYSITLDAYTPESGIAVGGITPTVFPWRGDWEQGPKGQGARVTVERQTIGAGRESSDSYFAQPSVRVESRSFKFSGNEPWQFLRYFQDMGGTARNLWLQGTSHETSLSFNVASTDTALTVADTSARGLNSFVMLDDGSQQALCKVTGTAGYNWNLASAVGKTFLASQTQVNPLMLCRFSRPRISMSWLHDELATVECDFTEVPWEIGTIAGETTGTTLGATAQRAYIYTFSIAIPDAEQVFRYTDFERDLTYSANTYTAKPFEHGDIREALGLERQTTSIKSRSFAGNPLLQLIPFSLEFPLMVEICEVDASGSTASNPWCVFYGEIVRVQSVGPFLTATAEAGGRILGRKIPRKLIQPTCNWTVFDGACGLSRSAWQWDALADSWNSGTYTLRVQTITKSGVPQTGLAEHYFAAGLLVIGTGANQQHRWIADNAAQDGGSINLILSSPITGTVTAGTVVRFYPGCDGRFETCVGKFSNRENFGGFPYLPTGNPSMAKVSKNLSSGGKK